MIGSEVLFYGCCDLLEIDRVENRDGSGAGLCCDIGRHFAPVTSRGLRLSNEEVQPGYIICCCDDEKLEFIMFGEEENSRATVAMLRQQQQHTTIGKFVDLVGQIEPQPVVYFLEVLKDDKALD
ncbi:hypothetical protein F0562_017880 [Nyssa sinensis]|uniref:Uncharacterized protein n=1 Tax=Nyssa sinensis TaxID=561372 RepID=A0A5J4ZBS8_9ASTE|nr:hypothetical protein F0562_017880 [Nyssa sinensis]